MHVIKRHLTDFAGDKTFITIPFDVDDTIERIEVSYAFPAGSAGSVIDIGLAHDSRSVGWTGSEYGHIWVSEDRASPGYRAGPLPGKWEAVLGVVKVGPECYVDIEIRQIPRRGRWLTGDLHSHTEHSDGGIPVTDAISRARNSGCDFVALTDHNTTAQNAVRPDDPGITAIPGMELTTYWGHTNMLGLENPVVSWRCDCVEDVPRRMAEAREAGATISINHPFQRSAGGRWQAGLDVPFDTIEIWNGIWKAQEQQALDLWQEMLVAGRRIPAVAGSDFHLKNRRRHARPANRLFAQSACVGDLLGAMRAGRNIIAAQPDATILTPMDGTPALGQVDSGATLGLALVGLAEGDSIRLIDETGITRDITAKIDQMALEERLTGRFLRVEVWRGGVPVVLSNPFFAE